MYNDTAKAAILSMVKFLKIIFYGAAADMLRNSANAIFISYHDLSDDNLSRLSFLSIFSSIVPILVPGHQKLAGPSARDGVLSLTPVGFEGKI